jgi:hypothetical protein
VVTTTGSAGDFATRTGVRPIYVTGQFDLNQALLDRALGFVREAAPRAEIIPARGLYTDLVDWEARWPAERAFYGGCVVVTADAATRLPIAFDEYAGSLPARLTAADLCKPLPFRGGHEVPAAVAIEIAAFVAMGRPVAWLGFEQPLPPFIELRRWLPQFAVERDPPAGTWFTSNAGAFLYSATDAEPFAPVIGKLPLLRRRHAGGRPRPVARA